MKKFFYLFLFLIVSTTLIAQSRKPSKKLVDIPKDTVYHHPTEVNKLAKIYFASSRSTIQPRHYSSLSQVAAYLKKHPKLQVEVKGYGLSSANSRYSLALRRAKNVIHFLLTFYHIRPNQLILNEDDSPEVALKISEMHRVELIILPDE